MSPDSVSALLVATAGGHLTQLNALAPRLGIDPDRAVWVTVPTTQSETLLAGRKVVWAEYTSPRDLYGSVKHLRLARSVIARHRPSIAVSTGASLAPPFFLAARLMGVPSHYIESATRVDGPSFSGRLVRRIPGVRLYSQYEAWATGRWHFGGSIFDGWSPEPRQARPSLTRAVVTVGSARGFAFDRMVRAAARALPEACDVTWQILDADPAGLRGRVVEEMSAADLRDALTGADVVISHAGTGSVLTALESGHCPIVVPRLAAHGEHVDDHQTQIARMLGERGLAVIRSADELVEQDLYEAAGLTAHRVPGPDFRLIA